MTIDVGNSINPYRPESTDSAEGIINTHTDQAINNDLVNPSAIQGLKLVEGTGLEVVDPSVGTIRNTGSAIELLKLELGLNVYTTTSTSKLNVYVERSTDNSVWEALPNSLVQLDISAHDNSYHNAHFVFDLPRDGYFRFRLFYEGSPLRLQPLTKTVGTSTDVVTPSARILF